MMITLHVLSLYIVSVIPLFGWVLFWTGQHIHGKVTGLAATLGIFGPVIPVVIYGLLFAS